MSYKFLPSTYYRMPTHFGPSLGPRQGLNDRRYSCFDSCTTAIQASFKADKVQLERLLPNGFSLREPCEITFDFNFNTNIEWLAGRGYNTFGVSVPATFTGTTDIVHGDFLLVLWENMADPIITGREDLGFSKIYCEIPEPEFLGNDVTCRASWDGFEFISLKLSDLTEIIGKNLPDTTEGEDSSEGLLHYKYIPKTGCPGKADVQYATLTPADWPNVEVDIIKQTSKAALTVNPGTWEQLPTLVHIVNIFSDLTLGDCTKASLTKTRGAKDLSDQRILK